MPEGRKVEKVLILGIEREPGWIYFLSGMEIWRRYPDQARLAHRRGLVTRLEFEREEGYIYFIDAEGDIARFPSSGIPTGRASAQQQTPARAASVRGRTFASVFPRAGHVVSKDGVDCWRIRGSGVSEPPDEAPLTKTIVDFLESEGVEVWYGGSRGICCADSYTIESAFLDGGLFAETGNYIGYRRGAHVRGRQAVLFVALGLGLKVPAKDLWRLRLVGVALADLRRGLAVSKR